MKKPTQKQRALAARKFLALEKKLDKLNALRSQLRAILLGGKSFKTKDLEVAINKSSRVVVASMKEFEERGFKSFLTKHKLTKKVNLIHLEVTKRKAGKYAKAS